MDDPHFGDGPRRSGCDAADALPCGSPCQLSRLAAIVESSDDAIIGKTLDGVITSWNHAAERMYGYTSADAIGKSIDILSPADRYGEIRAILDKVRRGEHVAHFETIRVRADGQPIAVSLTASPIKDQAGLVVGAATIARDITQRKHLEDERAPPPSMRAVSLRPASIRS